MAKTFIRFITTADLFNAVDKALASNHVLPEILDYGIPSWNDTPIKDIEFDVIGIVNFGSSEGIYLDLYLDGDIGTGERQKVKLGTYKTLEEDKEAFKTMSDLNVEFIFAAKHYIAENREKLMRTGYKVRFYKGETLCVAYISDTKEKARSLVKRELARKEDWTHAEIIDAESGIIKEIIKEA